MILDAALAEFAEYGYERASTNRIVEKAGIGKGMLFHYFKSKRQLFHYLVDYGIRYMMDEYIQWLDADETDFIERYKNAAQAKFEAYAKNPHVFDFLGNLYISEGTDLTDDLRNRLEKAVSQAMELLFKNIDMSHFRDDVPPDQALKIIRWSIEGHQNELMAKFKGKDLRTIDMDSYWAEFYDMLSVLRRVLYKHEEGSHGNSHHP